MKKYTQITLQAEATKKQLASYLIGKTIEEYEGAIVDFALDHNPNPIYGETFDNKGDAMNTASTYRIICKSSSFCGKLYEITLEGIIEIWEADEDGEFISGSDYDWKGNLFTREELEDLEKDLFG